MADDKTFQYLQRICKNCGETYGRHRAKDSACPSKYEDTRFSGYWRTSVFVDDLGEANLSGHPHEKGK